MQPTRRVHERRIEAALGCLLSGLLAVGLPLHAATVYKWTDEQGNTHFSDDPPPKDVPALRLRLPSRQTTRSDSSQRVRRIRCRDFRGALEQLEQLPEAVETNPQWLAAKEKAKAGIKKWCD